MLELTLDNYKVTVTRRRKKMSGRLRSSCPVHGGNQLFRKTWRYDGKRWAVRFTKRYPIRPGTRNEWTSASHFDQSYALKHS